MVLSLTAAEKKRDAYLRRTYGMGLVDYDQLLALQGNGCAICHKTPEEEGRNLAVDHVHTGPDKGKVRGLLCAAHNHRLVGRYRRDLGHHILLRAAADYLDREYHPFIAPEKKRRKRKRASKI